MKAAAAADPATGSIVTTLLGPNLWLWGRIRAEENEDEDSATTDRHYNNRWSKFDSCRSGQKGAAKERMMIEIDILFSVPNPIHPTNALHHRPFILAGLENQFFCLLLLMRVTNMSE